MHDLRIGFGVILIAEPGTNSIPGRLSLTTATALPGIPTTSAGEIPDIPGSTLSPVHQN